MYAIHPSRRLNELFAAKPYQGVRPEQATFLFVGLDANYAPDIADRPIFDRVLEYHDDGVAFWRRHGVHHPFLLPEYRGDGRKYHRSFAQIGFRQEHAALLSFVELLHVPTIGRNLLQPTDFAPSHLALVNDAIVNGRAQHVFVPAGVARLMRLTGEFPWLPKEPIDLGGALPVLHRTASKTVYMPLHFSVYGKFEQKKSAQALAMRALLPKPFGVSP